MSIMYTTSVTNTNTLRRIIRLQVQEVARVCSILIRINNTATGPEGGAFDFLPVQSGCMLHDSAVLQHA